MLRTGVSPSARKISADGSDRFSHNLTWEGKKRLSRVFRPGLNKIAMASVGVDRREAKIFTACMSLVRREKKMKNLHHFGARTATDSLQ